MEQLKSAPTADSTTNCKNGFFTSLVFPTRLHFTLVSCNTKHRRKIRSEEIGIFSIFYFVVFFFMNQTHLFMKCNSVICTSKCNSVIS